jgi:DNA-binding beta-propeller fold protein YncE
MVSRRTLFFAAGLILAVGGASAQTLSGPESLEYDAERDRYLVSNRSAGEILARATSGTLSLFTAEPTAPAGMEIVGNVVYVADQSRIRGYRLDDATPVINYQIPGASFLNGLASHPDGTRLYASDFSNANQRLLEISIADPQNVSHQVLLATTPFTPNGLAYDASNNRLLVVAWGNNARIAAFDFATLQLATVTNTTLGNIDGVAIDCDGSVYVSSWSVQAVRRFDAPLRIDSPPLNFAGGLSNPADITYNPVFGEIAVPNAGNSTLSFHPTVCQGVMFREQFEQR